MDGEDSVYNTVWVGVCGVDLNETAARFGYRDFIQALLHGHYITQYGSEGDLKLN